MRPCRRQRSAAPLMTPIAPPAPPITPSRAAMQKHVRGDRLLAQEAAALSEAPPGPRTRRAEERLADQQMRSTRPSRCTPQPGCPGPSSPAARHLERLGALARLHPQRQVALQLTLQPVLRREVGRSGMG